MLGKDTLIVYVRHLQSDGADTRRPLHNGPDHSLNPDYALVRNTVRTAREAYLAGNRVDVDLISQVLRDGPLKRLQPVLDAYAALPEDAHLRLVPGEMQRGKEIGQSLEEYLKTEMGRSISRIEVSPLDRAQDTARALKSGFGHRLFPLLTHSNSQLRERQAGRPVEQSTYLEIFLAKNPKEFARWLKEGDDYIPPGKNAESKSGFRRFVREGLVKSTQRALRYEGRTTLLVGHSQNLEQLIENNGGEARYTATGSATFFTAQRRTLAEVIKGTPRKLVVGETKVFVPYQNELV